MLHEGIMSMLLDFPVVPICFRFDCQRQVEVGHFGRRQVNSVASLHSPSHPHHNMPTSSTPLIEVQPPTKEELEAFLERHQSLLQLERDEEEEQTRLLNSNCSPKLLEQRGLALGGLGVSNISIGLGGKT